MTVRWVVRRTVYLLIGGAVALALLMVGSVLASPMQGDTITDLRPPAVVALVLMIGVGLLPGIREVQVTAAQTLLGATDVTVPVPMRWSHRWRTALWTFVHQAVGFAVGLAIALAAMVVSGAIAFAGGQDRIDILRRIERPDSVGAWVVLGGGALATLALASVFTLGGGLAARWSAPLLLGSSGEDRLAAAERRLRREQEYGRLSRDLHDGVGHALSAISLQAVAGERVVRGDPDKAAAALTSIQSLAADAVAELDQVLGVLRDGAAPTHPEPTLADLPDLVALHRDLGMTLEVEVGRGLRVPGPLSRMAYRISAEALSNAAKHAGPGPVQLRVSEEDRNVVVRTRNRIGTTTRPRPPRDGHGLAGLTDGVAVFGGTLSAGPDGADWVLEARLPTRGARG
jgi:signal transduction histidine kinase